MKLLVGSSVVTRHCRAWPLSWTACWPGTPVASATVAPWAIRIWAFTRSMPVTSSVTVCSTWMRGFTSMKKNSSVSMSMRNSTVPAFT